MANVIFICDGCGHQSVNDELCPSCGIKMYRDNDEWRDNYDDIEEPIEGDNEKLGET